MMPPFARLRTRLIARRLLVAFTGVWLYAALAPCLMADDAHCADCPPAPAAIHADDAACPPAATVDCALPDVSPVTLDVSAPLDAPVAVLAVVPAVTGMPPPLIRFERVSENAALRAPPPLALRPAVLLI